MHSSSRTFRFAALIALLLLAAVPGTSVSATPSLGAEESSVEESQVPPTPGGPRPAPAQIPRQSPAPRAGADITLGVWQWQRTERGEGTTTVAQDSGKYTVTFASGGRLAIQADCKQVGGSYARQGQQLTLQVDPTTLVVCAPESQEPQFLQDLHAVSGHVFTGESLVLVLGPEGGRMIFSPMPPASLTGSAWRLQSYTDGRGGVVPVLPDAQISATFGDDGVVGGSAGCNLYRGPYRIAGTGITIGPLITTRMACAPPIMEQEHAFLEALQASTTYAIVGDRLTLRDDSGAQQALFVRPSVQPIPRPAP